MSKTVPPPELPPVASDDQRRFALERLAVMVESLSHSADVRREVLLALAREWSARAALLWTFDAVRESDRPVPSARPQGQIEIGLGIQQLRIEPDRERELLEACGRSMAQAMAAAQPQVVKRDAVPQIPEGLALISVPFLQQRTPLAVAQLFVDENAAREFGTQWLQQLQPLVQSARPLQIAHPESDVHSGTSPPLPARSAETPVANNAELDRLLLELHRTLRLDHVVLTAVNDGRLLLGTDRLSLAVRRGGGLKIAAISGTEKVNQRADEVRLLRQLVRRVCETGLPLEYTGEIDQIPPPLEQDLANYVNRSQARMVRLLPLPEPERGLKTNLADADRASRNPRRPRIIGCLILESFSDSQLSPSVATTMDVLGRHVAIALRNSLRLNSVPLLALWRVAGTLQESLHGRTLTKVLLGLAAAVAIISGLALIPFPYRLTAEGRLLPAQRQQVFAPWDGHIVDVTVSSGQHVAAGQVLARLENEELRQQVVSLTNELQSEQQNELALQADIDAAHRQGEQDQEGRLRGDLQETRVKITGLQEQQEILRQRYARLVVTAPADGVVATFQVDQLLRDRPVARGDVLLEVMRDDGPWELEVEIPDHRMGHLLRQMEQADSQSVPVEFILQTDTATTFQGQLSRSDLASRAGLSRDSAAVVPARVELTDDPRLQRRIGAEVTAKIDCGAMNLGYVLFGDVLEFLQRQLWL